MKKLFIPFLVIVFLFLMGQKRMERIYPARPVRESFSNGVKNPLIFIPLIISISTGFIGNIPDKSKTLSNGVYLIPIGEVDGRVLEELKSSLKEKFNLEVVIGETLPKPDYAYNRRRRQYHSSPILDNLSRLRPDTLRYRDFGGQAYQVLGITELDLYVSNLNFVFGQAQMGGRVALISLARLREEFWGRRPDERLLKERALKEAVHELGHTLGLEHCPNPKCVMHFSNSLQDTDIKGSWFCPECEKKI